MNMVCKKCGAQLLPEDQFCPECGAKIIRKKRCPECGELLREGTKFCPGCGAQVGEARPVKRTDSESAARRRDDSEETPRKRSSSDIEPRKKANPAPPPKKRSVSREEPARRRDWEDDWDDEDDEEDSVDVLSILTVAVGCIILVIVAVLGFNLYQRYVPKNYDRVAEEQGSDEEEEYDEGNEESGQSLEAQQEDGEEELIEGASEAVGTLVTIADVNIRDNPGTQGTNVLMKAKKGTSYGYIETVEGGAWYKIVLTDVDGHEYGYVSADYVEIP